MKTFRRTNAVKRFCRRCLVAVKAGLFTDPHTYTFRDPFMESLEEWTRNLIYFAVVVGTFLALVWADELGR